MATTPTQYMGLQLPVPTVEIGPQYATDNNAAFTTVDQHDHSTGKGTPITPAGMNINKDLSFTAAASTGSNNAINLRSVRFSAQPNPLSAASDTGCVYESGIDLYYNDANGNQIRLTQGGAIAASPGSIGNLIPPANVTYNQGTATFVFQSSSATAGNLDGGSITLRNVVANSPGITISAPAALPGNYTITLPSSAPSTTAILAMTPSGNITTVGFRAPTQQRFFATSTTTYLNPGALYLVVTMCGGGGGGGGSGSGAAPGGNGTASTFGPPASTSMLQALGGQGGGASGAQGAIGGNFQILSPAFGYGFQGGYGESGASVASAAGGMGGMNSFGGGGSGGANGNFGQPGVTNTGAGGGGGGGNSGQAPGSGGSAGGWLKATIGSPSSSYLINVGTSGAPGGNGSGGFGGAAGATAIVIVDEYYN